jgi:hypothetical protein
MGNNKSKSSSNQMIDQKIINKNTLDSFNEQITKSTTESIMKSMTQSAASSSQNANINIGKMTASGPQSTITGLNIVIDQESYIDLQVADKSVQENDINSELALSIINNISSSIDNKQLTGLVSNVESKQDVAGIALTGGNKNATHILNNVKNLNETETSRKFTNIVTNVINQTSKTENIKSCITTDFKNASINISEITATGGGTISDIGLRLDQTSNIISKCLFDTQMVSNVTTALAQTFGFSVTDEIQNTQVVESETTAKATQSVKSIFDKYTLISSIVCALSCVIICVVFMFVYLQVIKTAAPIVGDVAKTVLAK